jgi:hypothetical protein
MANATATMVTSPAAMVLALLQAWMLAKELKRQEGYSGL